MFSSICFFHTEWKRCCNLPGNLPGVVATRLEERRSPLFTTRQKTIGLDRMIHEEIHPCISCSCQSTLETIQT